MADVFHDDPDISVAMERFENRQKQTEAIITGPAVEASKERRQMAHKPVKTVSEWNETFTNYINHPDDTGEFKYTISSFLSDTYSRDKDSEDYVPSVDDFDFAVMLEGKKHGDEAVKRVKNRFVNWLTWRRPEEVSEMRDEVKKLIFDKAPEISKHFASDNSLLENYLEKEESVFSLDALANKYKGEEENTWKDNVAANFLVFLKGYGYYDVLGDLAASANQERSKIRTKVNPYRADTGSAKIDTDGHWNAAREIFQSDEPLYKPKKLEVQEKLEPIELKFSENELDRLTNGPDLANMSAEDKRIRKAFLNFIDAWGRGGRISTVVLGLDNAKCSALIVKMYSGESVVLPAHILRSVLGLAPLRGWETGNKNFGKDTVVGLKFGEKPETYVYAKTPWKKMSDIFYNVKIDGKALASRPRFKKGPYVYVPLESLPV